MHDALPLPPAMHAPPSCEPLSANAPAVAALLAQRRAITNWDAFAAANSITGWDAATPVCDWTGTVCKPASTTANKFDMCGGLHGCSACATSVRTAPCLTHAACCAHCAET